MQSRNIQWHWTLVSQCIDSEEAIELPSNTLGYCESILYHGNKDGNIPTRKKRKPQRKEGLGKNLVVVTSN